MVRNYDKNFEKNNETMFGGKMTEKLLINNLINGEQNIIVKIGVIKMSITHHFYMDVILFNINLYGNTLTVIMKNC